jgi:hypothetical protein
MKKTIATITLAAIMTFGTTFANAGIIVAGRSADNGCTQTQDKDGIIVAGRGGIIVAGFAGSGVGIIVAGLTTVGIIVAGATDSQPCTTTTVERDGIIVAG